MSSEVIGVTYVFFKRGSKGKKISFQELACQKYYSIHLPNPKTNQNEMKKLFSLLTAIAVAGLLSCGPSAEEQKALEDAAKQMQDSLNQALQNAMNDMATPQQDTTAKEDTSAAPASGQ
jgi:hypothetical protein